MLIALTVMEVIPMSAIEKIVAKIPDWKKKKISITPLSGGLTNSNYKVEVN